MLTYNIDFNEVVEQSGFVSNYCPCPFSTIVPQPENLEIEPLEITQKLSKYLQTFPDSFEIIDIYLVQFDVFLEFHVKRSSQESRLTFFWLWNPDHRGKFS